MTELMMYYMRAYHIIRCDWHASRLMDVKYFIQGYSNPHEYIATQGPVPLTVTDMWYMAWQERTAILVMVTNLIESSNVSTVYIPLLILYPVEL